VLNGTIVSKNPTADDIARAIVAACRETGGDPIAVASAAQSYGGDNLPMVHARAYALMALIEAFPRYPEMRLAKLVGAGSPTVYASKLKRNVANGILRWWDTDVLWRVRNAMGRPAPSDALITRLPAKNARAPSCEPGGAIQNKSSRGGVDGHTTGALMRGAYLEPDTTCCAAGIKPGPREATPPRELPKFLPERPPVARFDATRPAATPGKRKLIDILAEAARNTAQMKG
jgi:hypothetical protein